MPPTTATYYCHRLLPPTTIESQRNNTQHYFSPKDPFEQPRQASQPALRDVFGGVHEQEREVHRCDGLAGLGRQRGLVVVALFVADEAGGVVEKHLGPPDGHDPQGVLSGRMSLRGDG